MMDLESVYDEEISPLVTRIIEICKKHDIPMFAEFQYSDDGYCRTALSDGGSGIFRHLNALSQCIEGTGVNIDKYMFWCLKESKNSGIKSSSIFLNQFES